MMEIDLHGFKHEEVEDKLANLLILPYWELRCTLVEKTMKELNGFFFHKLGTSMLSQFEKMT